VTRRRPPACRGVIEVPDHGSAPVSTTGRARARWGTAYRADRPRPVSRARDAGRLASCVREPGEAVPSCPDHGGSSERSGNGGPVSDAGALASLLPSVSGPDRAPRHDGRPSSTPACRGRHHRGDSTLRARSCRPPPGGRRRPAIGASSSMLSTSVNSACLDGPSRAAPVASPKVWVPDAKINPCRDRPPCSSSASRPPGLRYRLGRAIHELDRVHEAS
jgi:hypothetical protein